MRINVYNEELTEEVEIVHVYPNNRHFIGLRFLLESADKLHHTDADDDRSAVTFWVGDATRGRRLFQNALEMLDRAEASAAVVDESDEQPLEEPAPPDPEAPTVGRIVHYTGFGDEQHGECYAAIVTKVIGPSIDLTVFPPDKRDPFTDRDVTGGGDVPGNGQWHWPRHAPIVIKADDGDEDAERRFTEKITP